VKVTGCRKPNAATKNVQAATIPDEITKENLSLVSLARYE